MKTLRRFLLATAVCTALSPATTRASGGFYEQPLQTLADYLRLDQLPAKSPADIRNETLKSAPETPKINFTAELLDLPKKPGPQALASLDKMIAVARAAGNNPLLNLLHDIRDLFAGPANAEETAAYLEWRVEQADRFGVALQENKAPKKPQEEDYEQSKPKPPNRELVADIERHLAKASPALQPHWTYLRGAAEYLSHNIAASQPWFQKVVKDFPKSPRAEVALYMAARCQMWRTRSPEYTQFEPKLNAAERPAAKKLFDEYFAKYPHGAHFGDVLGWSGAFAYDAADYPAALRDYAQQLNLPDHPELVASASDMIEKVLSHIASATKEKAFDEVAKYPTAAQSLVYLVINTSESDNFNNKFDPIDEVRGWRKKVLPEIATAIAAESKLYQSAEWKPRYLAMLAYAASGAGPQDPALKLLDSAGASAEQSDDLLMARGVVLHRARRPGEAVTALQTLLEKFPGSPLAKGAQLRLALALTDDHHAGQAVLALKKLLPVPKDPTKKADEANPDANADEPNSQESYEETGQSPVYYDIDLDQVRALVDVLLNFAPIEELATTAQTPGLDPVQRLQFTEAIAQRLLAREQFDEAKKYLTPAQFGLVAEGLEKLTQQARDAKDPAAHAAACLKLADAWAAARGKLLTYPLDTTEYRTTTYISFAAEAQIRRADAAPFIGASGNYQLDLENRDELRHAFNWWLEASDADPHGPQAAQALWRALNAMPLIADVSPYTLKRAVSRKWGDVSHKLYDRLRADFPDSVEAKRYAVTWTFQLPKQPPNQPDDVFPVFRDAAGARFTGAYALEITDNGYNESPEGEQLVSEITGMEREVWRADPAKTRPKLEALRKRVRTAFQSQFNARWVNLVDDLALFLSEPDPGEAVRQRYVELRYRFVNKSAIGGGWQRDGDEGPDEKLLADIKAAVTDPANKAVADYFEFLRLAVIANHRTFVDLNPSSKEPKDTDNKDVDTYITRDYPSLEKETKAFLEKYPHSKKREAAMLIYARAVFRASEEIRLRKLVTWPQGARWEGGYEFRTTQQEPFDAKRVLAALDAYDQAFPHGLYAADIRAYRATVAYREHHWKSALDLTVAQLTGNADPGLNEEAANRLGEIFKQLTDERYRVDVMAVLKANKGVRNYLEKYLANDDDTNPLIYLKGWIHEQIAAK